MKKIWMNMIIIILMLSLTACSIASTDKNVNSENTLESEHKLISYDEFQEIFNTIGKKLNISGYSIKGSTIDSNIVIIDKENSFGKRNFLTINGNEDSQETQERIIFENKSKKCICLIDLIYLKSSIEKDLIFSHTFNPYDLENADLINKIDSLVLSYNNLLIKITIISDNKVDYNHTNKFTHEIVNILSELDKSVVSKK